MPRKNPNYNQPQRANCVSIDARPSSAATHVPEPQHVTTEPATSVCTILVGPDGKFVEVSDLFCKIIGFTRDDLLGMNHDSLIAPGTADRLPPDSPRKLTGCSQGLWLLTTRVGTRVLVHYDSRTRSDHMVQSQLEIVGAGY
jgi:PAS domain S-box-containing protein